MSATGDNTYTPKSPDLSSLYMGPEAHSASRLNRYPFPGSGTSTSPGTYHLQPPAQTQVQTQVQQPLETGSHNFSQPQLHYQYPSHQSHQSHHYNNNHRATNGSAATATITNYNAYHLPPQQQPQQHQHHQNQQHPQFTTYNSDSSSQHSLSAYPTQSSAQYYHHPPPRQQQPQYQPPHQQGYQSQATSSPYYSSYTDSPTSNGFLPTSQHLQQQHTHQQQRQQQQQQSQQPPQQQTIVFNQPTTPDTHNPMPRGKAVAQVAKEPDIMESPVRTKFPTARIKRIMQADEEVGKVAQQTPIAVGKALELFMVQLVHKSAEVAKDKNSKRITAPMLKQAIDSTNEWDFLREIVAKVAEDKEGARSGGRTKAESESDDDADAGEVKKKGRGGRKKKSVA
ncbi:hypothetical protein F5Y14DRAFT_13274 [Nemania sp. NC0429]|nr:hypothetical protein F5Y14DRAFT_13274 [Nemania sp. NC0429]